MLKLAHAVVVTPRRCGLYETTRELVVGLRKLGVDSRMVDPSADNDLHPGGDDDRGAKFADMNWAAKADILVNHSGLGSRLDDSGISVIHVAHGRPRLGFDGERAGKAPVYSYQYIKNKDPNFKVVVTFWPRYRPYLEIMFPDKPVCYVQPPVDLDAWTPDGPSNYNFGGKSGSPNVVIVDVHREDVDPFEAVHAFALFARKHRGAKLHLYCMPADRKGWNPLLKSIQDQGNLGEVTKWVTKGVDNIYRAADIMITPHVIATRTVRETMACGCPVGSMATTDIAKFAIEMESVLRMDRGDVRKMAEKQFNPDRTAKEFLAVVDSISLRVAA